ncbi:class I SAM-dependent methyltransferase [Streptomyces sp. CA-135486]|uniref:class I SAM-dependent methyltransferase n=1 Tax=Streptomyces sp. CA-135486 TaxID=3240049 RepID=UPI003D91A4E8
MQRQSEGPPHDHDLFAGTAAYYARYRPPYPAEVFDYLGHVFELGQGSTVLDLGCGTGQLAVPLARAGCQVWAVDPDPEMIVEGVRQEPVGGPGEIRWITGRAEDLRVADLPTIRLCTMGASFHWMDRDHVLRVLDEVIGPGGGAALVSGSASIWSRTGALEGAWLEVTREVITQFLGPRRRAGSGTYSHPERTHEEVLLESSFSAIEQRRFTSTRWLSVDEVIGQQLSTSYASPAQLGDQLPAFRAELSRRLTEIAPKEGFETVEHTGVVLARRGSGGGGTE